jgi:hypothetical protein
MNNSFNFNYFFCNLIKIIVKDLSLIIIHFSKLFQKDFNSNFKYFYFNSNSNLFTIINKYYHFLNYYYFIIIMKMIIPHYY